MLFFYPVVRCCGLQDALNGWKLPSNFSFKSFANECAHAYYSYNKENIIYYKLDNYYNSKFESGLVYNDPSFGFKWPNKKMIVSKKDRCLQTFSQFKKKIKSL